MKVMVRNKEIQIDEEDHPLFKSRNWQWTGRGYKHLKGYPWGGPVKDSQYLHRMIVGAQKGDVVDHINGDVCDNRKINLRICTTQQNRMNEGKREGKSSKYKGVYFNKSRNKYVASIKLNGKYHYLGLFLIERCAAKSYDLAAKKLFGEFARLNFP